MIQHVSGDGRGICTPWLGAIWPWGERLSPHLHSGKCHWLWGSGCQQWLLYWQVKGYLWHILLTRKKVSSMRDSQKKVLKGSIWLVLTNPFMKQMGAGDTAHLTWEEPQARSGSAVKCGTFWRLVVEIKRCGGMLMNPLTPASKLLPHWEWTCTYSQAKGI